MSTEKRVKISEEKNKKLEIISILGLILISIISFVFTNLLTSKKHNEISIFLNGLELTSIDGQEIDLNVPSSFVIGDKDGEYNIIEIKNNRVRCTDANCPDKICVSHGFLNPNIDNDIIVCAPHKLVIQYK